MPLSYGMNGDRPGGFSTLFGGGPHGGASWWRRPGWFSGPLLANPEFRARFLARLEALLTTVFTEEKFLPAIQGLAFRLRPEVALHARAQGQPEDALLREFDNHIDSFRRQLKNRRAFLLEAVRKERGR